jgi:hypothetical protein
MRPQARAMSPAPRAVPPAADGLAISPVSSQAVPAGGTGAACPDPGVISIWVLGRFAVRRGEADIPLREFGGRLAQQLLRLLALQRGALLPKDVIAGALWPQHPRRAPGPTSRCWSAASGGRWGTGP